MYLKAVPIVLLAAAVYFIASADQDLAWLSMGDQVGTAKYVIALVLVVIAYYLNSMPSMQLVKLPYPGFMKSAPPKYSGPMIEGYDGEGGAVKDFFDAISEADSSALSSSVSGSDLKTEEVIQAFSNLSMQDQ